MIAQEDRRILKAFAVGTTATLFLVFYAAVIGAAARFQALNGRLPQRGVDRARIAQDSWLSTLSDVSDLTGLLGVLCVLPLFAIGLYTAFPIQSVATRSQRRLGLLEILAAITFPFFVHIADPLSVEITHLLTGPRSQGAWLLAVLAFSILLFRLLGDFGRARVSAPLQAPGFPVSRILQSLAVGVVALAVILQAAVWGAGLRFDAIHGHWPTSPGADKSLARDEWLTVCRLAFSYGVFAIFWSSPILFAVGFALRKHGKSLLIAEIVTCGSFVIAWTGWMSMFD